MQCRPDPTLSALLATAAEHPSDAATLAALADRLTEVSAADRVEALRTLAEASARLASMQRAIGNNLTSHPAARRLGNRLRVRRDWPERDRQQGIGQARDSVICTIGEGLEHGRWYAVRLCWGGPVMPDDPFARYMGDSEYRLSADVVPLDGGRVVLTESSPPPTS